MERQKTTKSNQSSESKQTSIDITVFVLREFDARELVRMLSFLEIIRTLCTGFGRKEMM